MTILAQSFLALVSSDLLSLAFTSARHASIPF